MWQKNHHRITVLWGPIVESLRFFNCLEETKVGPIFGTRKSFIHHPRQGVRAGRLPLLLVFRYPLKKALLRKKPNGKLMQVAIPKKHDGGTKRQQSHTGTVGFNYILIYGLFDIESNPQTCIPQCTRRELEIRF